MRVKYEEATRHHVRTPCPEKYKVHTYLAAFELSGSVALGDV